MGKIGASSYGMPLGRVGIRSQGPIVKGFRKLSAKCRQSLLYRLHIYTI